jgi:hypothetical protein
LFFIFPAFVLCGLLEERRQALLYSMKRFVFGVPVANQLSSAVSKPHEYILRNFGLFVSVLRRVSSVSWVRFY